MLSKITRICLIVSMLLCILILFTTTLYSQDTNSKLKKELWYSIQEINSTTDSILKLEIVYDSLTRVEKEINYPVYGNDDMISVKEFSYKGDTIIELNRTENFDTLNRGVFLLKENNLRIQLEYRTYGWWISGSYSRLTSVSIREHKYNSKNEITELISYSDQKDTLSHWLYSYQYDSISNSTTQHCYEIKQNIHKKNITQLGLDFEQDENCVLNCNKQIQIKLDKLENSIGAINGTLLIENGDTTSLNFKTELILPNEYKTISYNFISYSNQRPFRIIYYYKFNELYRKENYRWIDGIWNLNEKEEYQIDELKNSKLKVRTTFDNGEITYKYKTLIKYEYY